MSYDKIQGMTEQQTDRTERGGVTTYYDGKPAEVKAQNSEIDARIKEIVKAKEVDGKQVYIYMDVDGCLIEGGLETAGNPKTLDQWVTENQEKIKNFQQNITRLKNEGFKVGLSTGRGLEFSKRLINAIFPEGGVDKSVVEGGLLIYDHNTDTYEVAPAVDQESAKVLEENREEIMEVGRGFGAAVEVGKQLAVSFNPPKDAEGKRNTDDFREKMKASLDPALVDELVITNSSSAVDITPKGVDKLTALEGIVGDGVVIYVGDGKNDETAMSGSDINLAPDNSHKDIKEFIKTSNKIGLLAAKTDLAGVTDMLRLIAAAEKVYVAKISQ